MADGAIARAKALAVRHKKPIGYVFVGGLNTLFGLAIFPLLLFVFPVLEQRYLFALFIAQAISIVFAFIMYKRTVFRTRGDLLREMWTFSSFYLIVFAVNWVTLPLLVEVAGIPPMIAQTGFSLFTVVTSYLWHSRLTFRIRRAIKRSKD